MLRTYHNSRAGVLVGRLVADDDGVCAESDVIFECGHSCSAFQFTELTAPQAFHSTRRSCADT